MMNNDIRAKIAAAGLKHKDVAAEAGMRPDYFSSRLSRELSPYNRLRIERAIETLTKRQNDKTTGD